MFILRRISGAGVQMNFALGKTYTLVDRYESPEDFKRSFKFYFESEDVPEFDAESREDPKRCYAFVSNHDGSDLYPLWSNQKAYIMTDSGKTFSNITQG